MTDRHQITTSSDARTVDRLRDLADRTGMSQADVLRMSLLMFEAWLDRNDPADIPMPSSRVREN
jgi:hypothetical protein